MKSWTLTLVGVVAVGCCCCDKPTAVERQFYSALGKATFTVFPTCVRVGRELKQDTASAEKIAAFLRERKLGEASVADVPVPIPMEPQRYQISMWRQSRDAFSSFVREQKIETDYAFLGELLKGRAEDAAGGVHCYVVAKDGTFVFGLHLNSHHPEMKGEPKSAEECTGALLEALRTRLEPQRGR